MCEHYFLQPIDHGESHWQLHHEGDAQPVGEFATFVAALDHVVRLTGVVPTFRQAQVHVRQDAASPWRTIYWPSGETARYSG